ncbi:extracellular solute-binding protein [Paenibacillus abyssi]|uniref:ABC transporter peptide-binding protein YtcQ n=1 Tax=Paenibacillus abyssi TaxID=1340531 RepID=A0A917G6M6_9BACL|nr:extracellular solute-binding protein [Paenibacillus abyssi]GGG25531.1 putative ABC transporter peptide-binding protein YtcQ [Paenibacillus abyssi]
MMQGKSVKQQMLWMLVLIVSISTVLAACSGSNQTANQEGNTGSGTTNDGGNAQPAPQDEAPVEITVMNHFFSPTPPSDDNPVKREIEKATNTKLNIQWVSSNNYVDKFNVTLASGDIPDLILVRDPFDPVFRQAANQGAFWDVSPYIQDYPNLSSKIAPIAWDLTKIDGANYGVPRPRPSEGEGFFILRKDWLDNVGLEPPTTSDELYEVMKAFVKQDPDQNGKDDTVAIAGQVNPTDMGTLGLLVNIFTGATGEWKEQDGQLVHVATLPETREGLEYAAKAYSEGLIPVDFASLKMTQVKEMFSAGKAGILVEKSGALQEYYDALAQANPEFDFMNLLPLTSINGYNPKGPGFAGMNAIPKSVPEEKMKKILAMMDKWMTDEVFILHQRGIEGIHHTLNNGEIELNTDKMTADAVGDFNQIVYVSDPYASTVKISFPEETKQLYAQIQDEREKTSVADSALGLYSETGTTYMPEFMKNQQDLKTKIILGREPITAWDDFVAKLQNDQNFIKMSEEINEAFKNR